MSYTTTISGYPNQTTEIVYNGYHTVIDNSSTYTTKIRAAIPKYSEITNVLASAEFEKGYSWASAKGWFATDTGTQIGSKHSLSNGTNTGKTTDVTSYFQSKTANSGEFVSGTSAIRAYFDGDTVPVTFVTRDKCLIYTYNKPTYKLNITKNLGPGYYKVGTESKVFVNGSEPTATYTDFTIETYDQTITLSETHGDCEKFTGWYDGDTLLSTNSTYSFTISQNSISSLTTYRVITAKFEKLVYTITAKDWDGTILATGQAYYGEEIGYTFLANSPTRKPDKNYHYVFSDWSPNVHTICYEPIDQIAQYTAVPHSMSYTLTAEGRRHHNCSGCEYNFLERPYDLCQENLFYFSDWAESNCAKINTGTLEYNISNATITITGTGDSYTMYGGSSDYYHIPITSGEEYIFKYNVLTTGTKQAFVFFYDANGNAVNGVGISQPHIGKYDGAPIIFTAPEGATQLAIRVGVRDTSTATFSNLIVCKTKHLRSLNETTSLIRRVYFADQEVSTVGNSSTLILNNAKRKGFDFNGWFADEACSTSLNLPFNLTSSKTIYPKWFERLGILGNETIKIFEGNSKVEIFLGTQKLF